MNAADDYEYVDETWPPAWLERAAFCSVCHTELHKDLLIPDERREDRVCSPECARKAGVQNPPKTGYPGQLGWGWRPMTEIHRDENDDD